MSRTRRKPIVIGEKIGRLKVIEYAGTGKYGKRYLCICDCGNTKVAIGAQMRVGHTRSCGCLFKETQLRMVTKHNKRYLRIYEIWKGMKKRCRNSNDFNYKNYGGRGIALCEEWNEFIQFYEWGMSNGYSDDLTIDRIDVDGNYEPSNCRWATIKEQANNKRNSLFLTHNGETHTVAEWAELLNIKSTTIYSRIRRGYTSEKIFAPVGKTKNAIL